MPRVIFFTASTLNGFLADADDNLDWLFAVEQARDTFPSFLEGIGAIVQGSTTYEWVLAHEDLLAHPEKWPAFYGARPTWVFTTRELPGVAGADVRFAAGAVREAWPAIAAAAGDRDVWLVGGGDLVGQFDDAGLLDEIRVQFAPVTLSGGRPLLPRTIDSTRLRLEGVARNGQFAELTYRVRHPEAEPKPGPEPEPEPTPAPDAHGA